MHSPHLNSSDARFSRHSMMRVPLQQLVRGVADKHLERTVAAQALALEGVDQQSACIADGICDA